MVRRTPMNVTYFAPAFVLLMSLLLLLLLLAPTLIAAFTTSSAVSERRIRGSKFLRTKRSQTIFSASASSSNKVSFNLFDSFLQKNKKNNFGSRSSSASGERAKVVIETFLEAYCQGDVQKITSMFSPDCVFDDYSFASPCMGRDNLERRLRLELYAGRFKSRRVKINDMVFSQDDSTNSIKIGLKFQYDDDNKRGLAFFVVDIDTEMINKIDWVVEPENKSGETSLQVLSVVSKLLTIGQIKKDENPLDRGSSSDPPTTGPVEPLTAPELYFEAWNRRDMDGAASLFAEDVVYEDTVFPEPLRGINNLRDHLIRCANVFPSSFTFQVDDKVSNNDNVCVQWHVENNGKPLPFTRGISFYELSNKSRQIQSGIDIVEPSGPVKPGGFTLFLDSMKQKIENEPARIVPITVWVAYMYIVFFSDGILPGANALALEERTWREVLDLSLNFFLVSPLLNLPFSPVVHPMLEGVFNLLLSWAAMFAGFLSDDRKDKPNLIPMLPIVVGMQFLTSAFLLPYLATRSTETSDRVYKEDLSLVSKVCESKALGVSMGVVGGGSILWAFLGRMADFGGLNERWSTFVDLIAIDRVGSSFIVDLIIFGLFQAWLVDDDLKRRGLTGDENPTIANIAKYVPFFGMAAYMMLRPQLPTRQGKD